VLGQKKQASKSSFWRSKVSRILGLAAYGCITPRGGAFLFSQREKELSSIEKKKLRAYVTRVAVIGQMLDSIISQMFAESRGAVRSSPARQPPARRQPARRRGEGGRADVSSHPKAVRCNKGLGVCVSKPIGFGCVFSLCGHI